ncbi:unnamed protein product [Adineta ricciae]|uniref:Uncharacterized protein n=1 Tax=Adineta ricciae TaxID=249248 RepID=A0A815BST1_ADIRI|nr:unnamed protein product [Adineta ricciae]
MCHLQSNSDKQDPITEKKPCLSHLIIYFKSIMSSQYMVFVLSLIVILTAFSINWIPFIILNCRIHAAIFGLCCLGTITSLCLAVVDQYFATYSRPRW